MNELSVRSLAAIAMMVVALAAAVLGGYYFAVLVAAAATAIFYEWTRIVRGWGAAWYIAGFFYALIPALALLWVRDRSDDGLALVLWIFIVTWATDVGAYFVGRAFGRAAPTGGRVAEPRRRPVTSRGGVGAAPGADHRGRRGPARDPRLPDPGRTRPGRHGGRLRGAPGLADAHR